MARTRLARWTAIAAAMTLPLTGCAGLLGKNSTSPTAVSRAGSAGAATEEAAKNTAITVTWLAVAGDKGGTGTTVISRTEPATKGDFRVEFSENEVGGIGQQSQAGAWNAAIISTLLLGEPLEGAFRFETSGRIDGPSAGALTTAGLIALARGEEFTDKVTMTGTINATGTVGPVGGIPEKVQAAGEAGFTTVLIPLGQRMSTNHKGETVDVVKEGDRAGVTVKEVGDIYEAYHELTGQELTMPGVSRDPRLDSASYDKVKPQTDAMLARYQTAGNRFGRLPTEIQDLFTEAGLVAFTDGFAAKAQDLQRQGLQAGAFNMSTIAATWAEALTATGELLVPLFTQGLEGLDTMFTQATDTSAVEREFFSFLDRLSTYNPRTVADVEGLVNAYAGAFDAYSLLSFAQQEIEVIIDRYNRDDFASWDEFFTALVMPVVWSQLASSQIVISGSTFEVGRDNPGAAISTEVDLAQVGDFFRRGADANMTAFTENVVAPWAESQGTSTNQLLAALSNVDPIVAAAVSQQRVQSAIADYIGAGKPNAAYATLGYGLNNYVRNQLLLDKYYNNAVLDDNLNVTGVMYDAVLNHALDLGKRQLADEISRLREGGTEPVISVGSYEVAGLQRNATVPEQFTAIGLYNGSFLISRTMSYLAGETGTK